jgi:ketosteroid isomerase-like protein
MKTILLFIFLSFCSGTHSQSQDKDLQTISSIINNQQTSWNKADLEGFMTPYWHSDSLMFIGKNGVKRGWQTTLDNYKKSYPTPDIMGKLTFTLIKMEKLDENAVFVVGKWALERKDGNVSGHFTLLWKKLNGSWVIVTDHSS